MASYPATPSSVSTTAFDVPQAGPATATYNQPNLINTGQVPVGQQPLQQSQPQQYYYPVQSGQYGQIGYNTAGVTVTATTGFQAQSNTQPMTMTPARRKSKNSGIVLLWVLVSIFVVLFIIGMAVLIYLCASEGNCGSGSEGYDRDRRYYSTHRSYSSHYYSGRGYYRRPCCG